MRYAFPADVLQEADGVTVTFPDVPEAITCGATRTEALEPAADALVSALATYVEDGRTTPPPSEPSGCPTVSVTALEATKLALHDAMIAAGVSNVELAHRLGLDEKAVRRLRDPLRRSDIGTLETALRSLGQRVEVTVRDAA